MPFYGWVKSGKDYDYAHHWHPIPRTIYAESHYSLATNPLLEKHYQGNNLLAIKRKTSSMKCILQNVEISHIKKFLSRCVCIFSPCAMHFLSQKMQNWRIANVEGKSHTYCKNQLTFEFEINFVPHFRHDRMNHSSWGWRISSHPSSTGKTVKTRTRVLKQKVH